MQILFFGHVPANEIWDVNSCVWGRINDVLVKVNKKSAVISVPDRQIRKQTSQALQKKLCYKILLMFPIVCKNIEVRSKKMHENKVSIQNNLKNIIQ